MKRAYEAAQRDDGFRVLVDRLWPRGVSKSDAKLDLWLKEVAPSAELRSSWHDDPKGHEPDHFEAFADEYRAELAEPPASAALDDLVALAKKEKRVTLVYGARDEQVNHVVVLREVVRKRAKK